MSDQHTTHFADCGCLAAQHAAEMKKALAERDAALRENLYYEKKIAGLEAEVVRLRGALQAASAEMENWELHWDAYGKRVYDVMQKALAGKEAEG